MLGWPSGHVFIMTSSKLKFSSSSFYTDPQIIPSPSPWRAFQSLKCAQSTRGVRKEVVHVGAQSSESLSHSRLEDARKRQERGKRGAHQPHEEQHNGWLSTCTNSRSEFYLSREISLLDGIIPNLSTHSSFSLTLNCQRTNTVNVDCTT